MISFGKLIAIALVGSLIAVALGTIGNLLSASFGAVLMYAAIFGSGMLAGRVLD